MSSGQLPTGLSLNFETGVISGTPTGLGWFNFQVSAADTSFLPRLIANQNFSVLSGSNNIHSLPVGNVNVPYEAHLFVSNGFPPYQFSLVSGSALPSGLSLASDGTIKGVPTQAGQTTFNVKMTDTTNQSGTFSLPLTISASNFDGPAELPRVFMDTSMPAQTGANTHVLAGQNLQTAINNANCGDTLLLDHTATFTGDFTLPAKPCAANQWIVIESDALGQLPAAGVR